MKRKEQDRRHDEALAKDSTKRRIVKNSNPKSAPLEHINDRNAVELLKQEILDLLNSRKARGTTC